MFVSPSVWMLSVDTSVEWPKTGILGLSQRLLMLFIYFYLFTSL